MVYALDNFTIQFSLQGTNTFLEGKYEGRIVGTAPVGQRTDGEGNILIPDSEEVVVKVSEFPIVTDCVPIRYLSPMGGNAQHKAVIIQGEGFGTVVWVRAVSDETLAVESLPRPGRKFTIARSRTNFVRDPRRW